MRFSRLAIHNFRGISHFQIDHLKDTVVLAGPNGCGKSCVLDAIRFLKSIYGGYSANELQQWFGEFQLNLRQIGELNRLLRNRNTPLDISADIQLRESERTYLATHAVDILTPVVWKRLLGQDQDFEILNIMFSQVMLERQADFQTALVAAAGRLATELSATTFTGGVTIQPDGQITVIDSLVLSALFQTYEPAHLGIIDYHSPARSYDREALGGVNLNLDAVTAQRRQFSLYNWREKYKNVKSELAAHYVRSMISNRAGISSGDAEDLNATLQSLFQTFFPDKSYSGPIAETDGTVSFPVTLSDGQTHDIDELSSGEKELLYGYLRLRNSSPRNSVILLDEPELHLNPRLLQGMPDFYHEHLGIALGSQLWLITHSDALLRQAVGNSNFSSFHMAPATTSGNANQAIPVQATLELDRAVVDIVGDLAAYKPLGKLVILEGGGDTDFDVHLVQRLFPEFAERVNLVSGGSKQRVRDLYMLLQSAADQAGLGQRFYAITDRDRDFSSPAETTVLRWDRYHIENYLLEFELMSEITNAVLNVVVTGEDIERQGREVAKGLMTRVVIDRLRSEVNERLVSTIDFGGPPSSSSAADALIPSISGTLTRFTESANELVDGTWLRDRETEIRSELNDALDDGRWTNEFPGRMLLRGYVSTHVPGVGYDAFRGLLLDRMVSAKIEPPGMLAVLRRVVDF